MFLRNATKMTAACTTARDPDSREYLVVLVKGTFDFPENGGVAKLSEVQKDLVYADEYSGEEGFTAIVKECDFVHYKPKCDVLLNGSAHAPPGRTANRISVGLSVSSMTKFFDVLGERKWEDGLLGLKAGEPSHFQKMPISYDVAYGGMDSHGNAPDKGKAYQSNPVGVGFYPVSSDRERSGKPLHTTVEIGEKEESHRGNYRAWSFGCVGRNFSERLAYAGTYDDEWQENRFPDLPADFDPRYYQSAPSDQWIDYPKGGERVVLKNLTSEGQCVFHLPTLEVPVEINTVDYERTELRTVIDTLFIDSDARNMTLSWRCAYPLKRNIMEVKDIIVGRMSRAFYRARDNGKVYYNGLAALIDS